MSFFAIAPLPALSNRVSLTKKQKDRFYSLIYHLLVGGFCLLMIYPILWMLASSLKGPSEIWTNVTSLIPQEFAFRNYVDGWKGFGGITYTTFFKNSFIYAGLGTVFTVMSSAIVAYSFARIRFTGRNFWFTCMLLTLMLPGQVLLVPQYILFQKLGWINTFLPLLVHRLGGGAFFIFFQRYLVEGISTTGLKG